MHTHREKASRRKAGRAVCGTLLAALAAAAAVELRYLPRYATDSSSFDIAEAAPAQQLRVMSANVRCFSPTDLGKKSWFYRAPLLCGSIADAEPDVIGFQEVTPLHYEYLTKHLHGYAHSVTYRNKAPLSEGCPIFYSTSRFDALEEGTFWLSETPEHSSKSWGAAFPRICAYALLRQKTDGKTFVVCNTHLDHVSSEARIRGMELIVERVRQMGGYSCILLGDLNAEEDSETYRAASQLFDDAKYRTENPPKGPTYQHWGKSLQAENIDYFLISKSGVDVLSYQIMDTLYDGVYPSDHFPIFAQFQIL